MNEPPKVNAKGKPVGTGLKRHRTVFGKVRLEVGGKPCVVRMTKTRLEVRPLHGRRVFWLPLRVVAMEVMAYSAMDPTPPPMPPPIVTNVRGDDPNP